MRIDRRKIRSATEKSLFFFARDVCGLSDLNEYHEELCSELANPANARYGVHWPRGTFKTSIGLCELLRAVAMNPEERCLVASGTDADAKKRIRFLKLQMETNEILPVVWPEVFWTDPENQSSFWGDEGLTVCRKGIYVDPTFFPGSVESNAVGQHATRGFLDDLVNRDNSKSETGRQDVLDYWQLLRPVFTKLGALGDTFVERIFGTPWDFGDAYAWIRENDPGIKWNVRGIWLSESGGKTMMDPLFDAGYYAAIRNSMSEDKWAAQYLCSPISSENAHFKLADFEEPRMYVNLPKLSMSVSVTMDPAKKSSKDADNTAITVRGISSGGHRWCLASWAGHLESFDRVKKLMEICRSAASEYNCVPIVGIEDPDFIDLPSFRQLMDRERTWFPLYEIKHRGRSKASRIDSLQSHVEQGRFHLHVSMREDLEEFLRHPKGRRDDRADSWAMHEDLPVSPPGEKTLQPEYLRVDETFRRIAVKRNRDGRRDPVGITPNWSSNEVETSWMV